MKNLILAALVILVGACGREPQSAPGAGQAAGPLVHLFHNGLIYTVDEDRPVATAMAFDGANLSSALRTLRSGGRLWGFRRRGRVICAG